MPNVSLTPTLEKFVADQVAQGLYNNASEVHRAALRELSHKESERQKKMALLDDALQLGIGAIKNGEFQELSTPQDSDSIFSEIRDRSITPSSQVDA